MGRHDDIFAGFDEVNNDVFEDGGVDGVEATEWLIEHDEVWVVDDGGHELDFLLVAFGKLFGGHFEVFFDFETFCPFTD